MATGRRWSEQEPPLRVKKRLIVCCDGTWMNSDYGYVKPSPLSGKGGLQVPSNVTRISRCFKRRCDDGTLQIINYESGVGSGSSVLDGIRGGVFGVGLAERVREAYAYLCANYTDGDEIYLVGFSRGAFTVRSVAGMIGSLGLLTRQGVEHFYPIFKDMQHWMDDRYEDPFPRCPFPNKPKGRRAAERYRERLLRRGLTRVEQRTGELITIKAVCVWDTVGSLGIPRIPWLEKLGIRPSNDEYWHDTALSDRIEHAFQALALDETRSPFSPAVWERPWKVRVRTDLRQVWFPGNHGNCGGGWDDQGMSDVTLACAAASGMMDQMSSVGVEFEPLALHRIVQQSVGFYTNPPRQSAKQGRRRRARWAVDAIYTRNHPVRPWALGAIQKASNLLYSFAGEATRTPGMYRQVDPETQLQTGKFLQHTSESVHSSVRVRLACEGLGLNDDSTWTCQALSGWQLERVTVITSEPAQAPCRGVYCEDDGDRKHELDKVEERWMWTYVGDERDGTDGMEMWEERLGPYERLLLDLSGGAPNVYEYAGKRMDKQRRRRPRSRGG
ncbi:uncharacterized protein DCS_01169 [Drechmeria coniospora]|uniref:T6SS Phospholipase effector Tle1-like catalytic domain-containing protein n=1 Tax=Drechmeria coniospora TaxID=98403 RepID=A0A151GSG0_DRECN|nr:uncharacterized protein DCS_01169 [Drechmeria coniospora]KYK60035.1 uncharacterized protein DCS_01169 [Drechmeria coniospora]